MDNITTIIPNFLDVDYLVEYLIDVSVQNKVLAIEELKADAKSAKVSISAVNKQIKLAETKIIQIHQNKLRQQHKLTDMPEQIKNTTGYIINEYGIKMCMPNSEAMLEICSKPIFITERYQDIDTSEEKVNFVYKTDGKWKETIIPREWIANSNKIMELAKFPTGINSDNSRSIIKYLNDIESENRGTILIKKAVSSLGWTEFGFVPYIDDVVFAGGDNYNLIYKRMKNKGNFDTWKQLHIDALKFPIPRVAIACAYGSILLKPLGVNGFCVHMWGVSGKGKTIAEMFATSVYGNSDDKEGLIRNGAITENAIESVMGFYGNCMLAIDELSNQTPEQLTKLVYKISNGLGKDRMTRSIGMQKVSSWNNITLLNAEKQITDAQSLSGMLNRLIQIESTEDVFGTDNNNDMRDIANAIREHYGFGAKLFIEAIDKCDFKQIFKDYKSKIPAKYEAKQVNSVCVLLTAYHIACKYIYDIPNEFTFDYFKDIIQTQEQNSMVLRNYNSLIEYIDANYLMFDDDNTLKQSKWGKYTKDGYICILPERFNEWCRKHNINSDTLLKGLKAKNLLKTTGEKRLKFRTNGLTGSGTKMSFIAIKEKLADFVDELEEVEDGAMPF